MPKLQLTVNSVDLVPADNIYLLEDRQTATAVVDQDIYGAPVVITKEFAASKMSWTLGAAYVPLSVVQGCIDAYHSNTHIVLSDERGIATTVVIAEYPAIERLQSLDQLIYSIKLTLVQDSGTFGKPPVLSTAGPRLFGR